MKGYKPPPKKSRRPNKPTPAPPPKKIMNDKDIFEAARELDKKINKEDRKKLLGSMGYKDKGINLMITTKVPLQVAFHIALVHFKLKKYGIGALGGK